MKRGPARQGRAPPIRKAFALTKSSIAAIADDDAILPRSLENPRLALLRRVTAHCRAFQGADLKRSLGQVSIALGLYAATITLMIFLAVEGLWWATLALSPVAAGLLVKLFTIQHDCGHGSYFRSRWANAAVGQLISILTFTPYAFWRDAHNRHHATSGHLDKRGLGAVDTLTVEEYRALSPGKRLAYRLYRHPVVMFFVGAPLYFLILQRLPLGGPMPFSEAYHGMELRKIWKSVVSLNLLLVGFYGVLSLLIGLGPVALAVLPTVSIAAWVGAWLFFVQHQYEGTYWARNGEWNFAEAAVFGSSHYDLPKPLHWLTGNIGLHHIHHLSSLIPNYRLHECLRASADLLAMPRLSMIESLKCARLALWDEAARQMISFRALKQRMALAGV